MKTNCSKGYRKILNPEHSKPPYKTHDEFSENSYVPNITIHQNPAGKGLLISELCKIRASEKYLDYCGLQSNTLGSGLWLFNAHASV